MFGFLRLFKLLIIFYALYLITESQTGRGWKGPLVQPPDKEDSPRVGCTGPHPGRS